MTSREIKILATLAKYQKQIAGWKFEPCSKPYTWYRINKPGEIPPHIAVGYLKEADFRNYEELQYLIRGIWDEQLNPPEFPDYSINIYYISTQEKCIETYNPYKATVESIAAMVKKYASFDSNLQDFYDNVKIKCKDAIEYNQNLDRTKNQTTNNHGNL